MPHKISILVRADVGRGTIELLVSGCLTEETREVLTAQISKARSLDPSSPILVNFSDAQHIDHLSLERLRSAEQIQREIDDHPLAALRFVLPETTPTCPQQGGADAADS